MSALARPSTGVTRVRIADAGDAARWDRYLDAYPDNALFHRRAWAQAAETAYGYRTHHLIAERNGEIAGVAPICDVASPLFGRMLVSTGFSVGGGALADDADAEAALIDAAIALASDCGARSIEMRRDRRPGAGWRESSGVFASFSMDLPKDEETLLAGIPRKRRAEIRKALSAEAAGDITLQISDDIDAFYRLYARALRDHGTPVFPKAFLAALLSAFGEQAELSFACVGGKPIAGLVSFYEKDAAYPYYIGAGPCARSYRAAEYLYFKLMRRAQMRRCRRFDFGRSRIGSGPYQFKRLWGAAPAPLTYFRWDANGGAGQALNPTSTRFAPFVSAWRKLPLAAANLVGPRIAGNFP